jgi:hypothetical protein
LMLNAGCTAAERLSFREAMVELRRAYDAADGGHILDAFDEARRRSPLFRGLAAVLERAYPVRAFLERAASTFDPLIADFGLYQGCRRIFGALGITWACRIPPDAAETLRTRPVIFYGNHPSLLTPFLLAASIEREDLRFCSTSYVRRLVPSFRPYCLPLEVPLTQSWVEWRRGGLRRVLAYRLLSLLHRVPDREAARASNLDTLRRSADHLRAGGAVMIIPGGGGKRDRAWFPGIGILARELLEGSGAQPVHVVPTQEENSSNHRIYASLQRGPLARIKNHVYSRRPIRLTFAEPALLEVVVGSAATVPAIVAALRAHYESCFPR